MKQSPCGCNLIMLSGKSIGFQHLVYIFLVFIKSIVYSSSFSPNFEILLEISDGINIYLSCANIIFGWY